MHVFGELNIVRMRTFCWVVFKEASVRSNLMWSLIQNSNGQPFWGPYVLRSCLKSKGMCCTSSQLSVYYLKGFFLAKTLGERGENEWEGMEGGASLSKLRAIFAAD